MQARPKTSTGQVLLNEVAQLPNETTPNYKVATAATVIFGLDTLLSWANCGSTSFYFNFIATLASAGVAYNQYNNGSTLKKAQAMYSGIFGKSKAQEVPVAAVENEVKAPTLS